LHLLHVVLDLVRELVDGTSLLEPPTHPAATSRELRTSATSVILGTAPRCPAERDDASPRGTMFGFARA
jgi:hypothetical protein